RINPYVSPSSVVTSSHKQIATKIKQIYVMARSEFTPVTFGDVVHVQGAKYSILSGDALMTILAKALRPSMVVFATIVDGIYKDMKSKELVPVIRSGGKYSINFSKGWVSVATVGMV